MSSSFNRRNKVSVKNKEGAIFNFKKETLESLLADKPAFVWADGGRFVFCNELGFDELNENEISARPYVLGKEEIEGLLSDKPVVVTDNITKAFMVMNNASQSIWMDFEKTKHTFALPKWLIGNA